MCHAVACFEAAHHQLGRLDPTSNHPRDRNTQQLRDLPPSLGRAQIVNARTDHARLAPLLARSCHVHSMPPC